MEILNTHKKTDKTSTCTFFCTCIEDCYFVYKSHVPDKN